MSSTIAEMATAEAPTTLNPTMFAPLPDSLLKDRQTEILFKQSSVTLLATLVTACIMAATLWPYVPHQAVTLWLAVTLAVTAVRVLLVVRYLGSTPGSIAPSLGWIRRYRLLALASGVVWGLSAWLLDGTTEMLPQILVLLFAGGLVAGATSAYAIDLKSYAAFVVAVSSLLAWHFLMTATAFGQVTGGMTILFVIFMSLYAMRLNRTLLQTLALQFANDALLRELDAHQRTLEQQVAERTLVLERTNTRLKREITRSRELTARLTYQATHDALTKLINRSEFETRLDRVLTKAKHDGSHHVLCYFDLDRFKIINDSCGHSAGDALLRQVASHISEQIRHRDTLARLGGDEFGILMEHCSMQQAQRTVHAVYDFLRSFRFHWADRAFSIGVSMGVIPINAESGGISDVLKQADVACYEAKDQGRNRIHIIDRPRDATLERRHEELERVAQIEEALREDRFCLYAQSIVPLHDRFAPGSHCEILLRLTDAEEGIVAPAVFMPAAERYNLVTKIDKWVVNNLLAWLQDNPGYVQNMEQCSVNLSGQSLSDPAFQSYLVSAIRNSNILPGKICFEITETAAVSNFPLVTQLIQALRGLGCRFALDDFGTGLSSFSYLRSLPVDFLKIDGCFVRDLPEDSVAEAMVRSINEIGHLLGKKTVAEYVVNEQVYACIKAIGVDYAQGYAISEPVPLARCVADASQRQFVPA